LPKKPRSALKKDLTAYFGDGKRSPVPTTAGNLIDTVIQRRELRPGTPKGKGGSKTEAGGKTDDTNSWSTPIVKKKRDKSKATPHDVEDEEGQHNKKPRSDDEDSVEQSKGTEQAGHTVDLESMSGSLRKKSPKTKIPKSKKNKEKREDSAKKPTNQAPKKKATFAPEESEESGRKKEEGEVAVNF
jgi:hypothetical protein